MQGLYKTRFVRSGTKITFRYSMMEKNFTVNHFVDILRGSKNNKVLTSNWNTDPIYKKGTVYSIDDCNRFDKFSNILGFMVYANTTSNKVQFEHARIKN